LQKIAKGCPSDRRSLQPSREHPALQNMTFFWRVIFSLLNPDPDPATQINADPCGSGSETPMNIRDWSANKIKSLLFQSLL
jgi:hypothetical protein